MAKHDKDFAESLTENWERFTWEEGASRSLASREGDDQRRSPFHSRGMLTPCDQHPGVYKTSKSLEAALEQRERFRESKIAQVFAPLWSRTPADIGPDLSTVTHLCRQRARGMREHSPRPLIAGIG